MNHTGATVDERSASEIMAEARRLQDRHAPRVFAAAVRWLRDAVAPMGRESGASGGRHLTVH